MVATDEMVPSRKRKNGRTNGSTRRSVPTFTAARSARRLVGAVFDCLIVLPTIGIFCWMTGQVAQLRLPVGEKNTIDYWIDAILTAEPSIVGFTGLATAIFVMYLFLFHYAWQGTPGMRLVGIRVIDSYGMVPSARRILLRVVGYILCIASLLLGFLWASFDKKRQGLHDLLSGTHVVKG